MLRWVLCSVIIGFAVIAILLPNRIVDTSSCKMNWTFILMILSGCSLIIEEDFIAVILMFILTVGILINRMKFRVFNIWKHPDEI